jgi:hypothetical protein
MTAAVPQASDAVRFHRALSRAALRLQRVYQPLLRS